MITGGALIILLAIIALIWIIVEFKRFEHKIYAYFLIALVLFLAISFSTVTSQHEIDYSSPSGVLTAGKIYFSWLGSVFGNVKTITSQAVKLDWTGDEEVEEIEFKNPLG